MFNLFKIELLRHRNLALAVALLHFAVLYYLYTLGVSLLQSMQGLLWLLFAMVLAAGFGIFQMALHKRGNDWLYLLHRPLPIQKIFLALALAGCCLAVLITAVPLAFYVMMMDASQSFGIESRHYQSISYASAAVLTAYCCGCFAALGASRLGFLALAILMIFVVVTADAELLFSSLLMMTWALLLARAAFKPDLSQPPSRVRTLILTELPIQCGCLTIITALTAGIVAADNYLEGTNRRLDPVPGSDDFVWVMPAQEVMQYALEHSSHADAARLDQQVALGETMDVGPVSYNRDPRRGQLPFIDTGLLLADGQQQVLWRFRHDVMLFEGRDTNTTALIGHVGPDGFHNDDASPPDKRFDSVPWAVADQFIISNDDIYQISWPDRQVHHRYHSDDPDRFNNSLTLGENISALFSDSKLYLFGSAELRDPTRPLSPKAILDVPDTSPPDLRKLSVLPLSDGYLVSALLDQTPFSDAPDFATLGHARLQLYRVRGTEAELIASTALPAGVSDWVLYKDLIVSPGIRLGHDFLTGMRLRASAEVTLPLLYVKFPLKILIASGIACLLCAGITAWLLQRSALPKRIKVFWIIGNGLTGFAGLLSFFFGYYWKRGDLLHIETGATNPLQVSESTSLRYTP